MSLYVQPGEPFEASLSNAPTGLTGTLGVQIIDTPSGSTFLARTTSDIVENPAGSGVYSRSFTAAPTDRGTYSIVWDTGGSTPTYVSEDLIVTNTLPADTGAGLGPFISRTDLGNYVGQDLSTDEKALIAVDAACDICRTVSDQTFNEVTDETVTLDGTGTDALPLPQHPVIDVTDVTENGQPLVVDDDYKLNGGGVLLRMPTVDDCGVYWKTWRCGRQNISVTYSHGYPSNSLPRDVRVVALSIAARLYQRSSGVVFESLGQQSVRYDASASDLSDNELRILQKYRRSR